MIPDNWWSWVLKRFWRSTVGWSTSGASKCPFSPLLTSPCSWQFDALPLLSFTVFPHVLLFNLNRTRMLETLIRRFAVSEGPVLPPSTDSMSSYSLSSDFLFLPFCVLFCLLTCWTLHDYYISHGNLLLKQKLVNKVVIGSLLMM